MMTFIQLTERERDILSLLVRGMTNRQIGKALHLAEGTVENHLHRIYGKLDVKSRTEAVVLTLRENLLQ